MYRLAFAGIFTNLRCLGSGVLAKVNKLLSREKNHAHACISKLIINIIRYRKQFTKNNKI